MPQRNAVILRAMHILDELAARGFLYQYTDEKLFDIYNPGGQTFYFGCDPTADSLHLGNFIVYLFIKIN